MVEEDGELGDSVSADVLIAQSYNRWSGLEKDLSCMLINITSTVRFNSFPIRRPRPDYRGEHRDVTLTFDSFCRQNNSNWTSSFQSSCDVSKNQL